MSHVKTWACIKPDGDGCDGDHNPDTTPRAEINYCAPREGNYSAFGVRVKANGGDNLTESAIQSLKAQLAERDARIAELEEDNAELMYSVRSSASNCVDLHKELLDKFAAVEKARDEARKNTLRMEHAAQDWRQLAEDAKPYIGSDRITHWTAEREWIDRLKALRGEKT